ncbi:MAG: hypothetical protein ABSD98_09660 [Candidatus Korobacteraceae bacterium]|jgi:hypothetical protein
MKGIKNHLAAIVFFVQLAICWATVFAVRHLEYRYSNILYPFLLRLQAAFAETLRPLLGNSMGLTSLVLAAVSFSAIALVSALFCRSSRMAFRLIGYALFALLAIVDVFWSSTSALRRCC